MSDLGWAAPVALSAAVWVYLLAFRGGFWRADQRLADDVPALTEWPAVVAVIPARNEAATIGRTVGSLLAQDYGGDLRIVVVDDHSDDGTKKAAGADPRLGVVAAPPLQPGWTGKLSAIAFGVEEARRRHRDARYLLLTDADIEHDPRSLSRLVAKAEAGRLDLVSLMVLLRRRSLWEHLLIPAFVFFFQKLYPFPWVNDPARPTAAAAGGCMLVRLAALDAAGGIAAIRDRLIDDCALAKLLKAHGSIWLGLTARVRSLRAYDGLGEVWRMVARSAYAQLGFSPAMLVVAVLGMALTYLVPPVAALGLLGVGGAAQALGVFAWLVLMPLAFRPTLRLYGLSPAWAAALPVSALHYTMMTVSSAVEHWRGRGGSWKGRHYGPGMGA